MSSRVIGLLLANVVVGAAGQQRPARSTDGAGASDAREVVEAVLAYTEESFAPDTRGAPFELSADGARRGGGVGRDVEARVGNRTAIALPVFEAVPSHGDGGTEATLTQQEFDVSGCGPSAEDVLLIDVRVPLPARPKPAESAVGVRDDDYLGIAGGQSTGYAYKVGAKGAAAGGRDVDWRRVHPPSPVGGERNVSEGVGGTPDLFPIEGKWKVWSVREEE
jgi:hypothetical protein